MFDTATSLSIVGILVAVAITVYFEWWRKRRRLSYKVISSGNLARPHGGVEVIFDGRKVDRVWFISLKLINDGFQPIKAEYFEEPIVLYFLEDEEILTVETIESYPNYFDVEPRLVDNTVEIAPKLFNRGDYVVLHLLVSFNSNRISLDIQSRIEGIDVIRASNTSTYKTYLLPMLFLQLALGTSIILIISEPLSPLMGVKILVLSLFGTLISWRLFPQVGIRWKSTDSLFYRFSSKLSGK